MDESTSFEMIDRIIQESIRPVLKADGGDITLIDFSEGVVKADIGIDAAGDGAVDDDLLLLLQKLDQPLFVADEVGDQAGFMVEKSSDLVLFDF